jgi:DNA helicase IV
LTVISLLIAGLQRKAAKDATITLLLKGLEADVSVILNTGDVNRQNLYVAMTRAVAA